MLIVKEDGWMRQISGMNDIHQRKERQLETKSADIRRKPYAAPKIEVFGSVQELTMGFGGSRSDGFIGRRRGGS
ncbi:MAG: lasso RiPP family leader peptide-containing protein [Candidatus Binataceae bacterium]